MSSTSPARRTVPAAALPHVLRLAAVATVTESGYLHAKLYVNGYHFIHDVGVMFLLQASVSFAVAALLLVSAQPVLQLAAAGTAVGALGGFVMSRTTGVAGFRERGLQPAPDALLSVLAESATIVLVAALAAQVLVARRRRGERLWPWPGPGLRAARGGAGVRDAGGAVGGDAGGVTGGDGQDAPTAPDTPDTPDATAGA